MAKPVVHCSNCQLLLVDLSGRILIDSGLCFYCEPETPFYDPDSDFWEGLARWHSCSHRLDWKTAAQTLSPQARLGLPTWAQWCLSYYTASFSEYQKPLIIPEPPPVEEIEEKSEGDRLVDFFFGGNQGWGKSNDYE